MRNIKGALGIVMTVLASSWDIVRAALGGGRRRVTASLAQLDTIRRSYALGAASREQFDTAVRKLGPSVRSASRLDPKKRSRKKAA